MAECTNLVFLNLAVLPRRVRADGRVQLVLSINTPDKATRSATSHIVHVRRPNVKVPCAIV